MNFDDYISEGLTPEKSKKRVLDDLSKAFDLMDKTLDILNNIKNGNKHKDLRGHLKNCDMFSCQVEG